MEIHRARRFYERPEAQAHLQRAPRPGARRCHDRRRPGPDFHERCSLVGDHPALQRSSGSSSTSRSNDPPRLATSQWLSARIVPAGDDRRPAGPPAPAARPSATPSSRSRDRGLARTAGCASATTALRACSTWIPTAPRSSSTATSGRCRGCWRSSRTATRCTPRPPRCARIGFTVVRHQKALQTQDRIEPPERRSRQQVDGVRPAAARRPRTSPTGMRVEVWDDTDQRLVHAARAAPSTSRSLEHGKVLDDAARGGLHPGHDGHRDAERRQQPGARARGDVRLGGMEPQRRRDPGKRVRHEDGDEIVEDQDADPDPVTPLLVTAERRGRARCRGCATAARTPSGRGRSTSPATAAATSIGPVPAPVVGRERRQSRRSPAADADHLARGFAEAELRAQTLRVGDARPILAARAVARSRTGCPRCRRSLRQLGVETAVASSRLRAAAQRPPRVRARDREPATARRSSRAPSATPSLDDDPAVHRRDTAPRSRRARRAAIGDLERRTVALDELLDRRHAAAAVPALGPGAAARPSCRCSASRAGESLRQLVIRSGVTQDLDTLEITVDATRRRTRPDAPRPRLSRRRASATSRRRRRARARPSCTARSTTRSDRPTPPITSALLAVALREAGRCSTSTCPGSTTRRSAIRSWASTSLAGPDGSGRRAEDAARCRRARRRSPGQYVVHDTAAAVLPYLPDVLARGHLARVPGGRPRPHRSRSRSAPRASPPATSATGRRPRPFRLVLDGCGRARRASSTGTSCTSACRAGDVQRFRLASSLDRADLDRFGLWRSLPPALTANADVAEAAADGWLWALTPFEEVTLVHAVPRPLEAPRPTTIDPARAARAPSTSASSAPSTSTGRAPSRSPRRPLDRSRRRPRPRRWESGRQTGVAFTTTIRPERGPRGARAGGVKDALRQRCPAFGPVWIHSRRPPASATPGTTRCATGSAPPPASASTSTRRRSHPLHRPPARSTRRRPVDDGKSVVGPEITLNVPSSARPAAPVVHSVLPLFRWDEGTEPEQPVAVRRRRRAGVRIYLERPWYSSGEGELLGVLLAPGGDDTRPARHLVSQWGADPVWVSAPVAQRAMCSSSTTCCTCSGSTIVRAMPGPVGPPATLPLAAVAGRAGCHRARLPAAVQQERGLWYVDIAIDPGSTFWPFVRLAVARYQPDSIDGCHLSTPTLCDFVQLTPERTDERQPHRRPARAGRRQRAGRRPVPAGPARSRRRADRRRDSARGSRSNRKVVARLQQPRPVDPDRPRLEDRRRHGAHRPRPRPQPVRGGMGRRARVARRRHPARTGRATTTSGE